MNLFGSITAQRRNFAHCAKWIGLRAAILAVVFTATWFERAALGWSQSARDKPTETVVLLHGMGRSRASMLVLAERLQQAGYETANFPYRTAGVTLDDITKDLRTFVDTKVATKRYHIVTHSLGGVIVRNAFKDEGLSAGLGRIVMLAPPNRPAEMARIFKSNIVYKWITGETGHKLGEEEFYATLPVPPVEFGIIAGTRGQKISFDEPNDGIVTVSGTRLDGMKDHIELRHTHTLIMNSRDTAEQAVAFLRTGCFQRKQDDL